MIEQVRKERKNGWTTLELSILKNCWSKSRSSQWIHLLPNRSFCAIKTKVRDLGLERDWDIYSQKKQFICKICGKSFQGYGNKILCSRECTAKYMSKLRLGENNPNYNPNKFSKINCLNCGLEFEYLIQKTREAPKFCSKKCFQEYSVQEKASRWEGGIQFLPYSNEFNKKLKKNIKERDGNKCVFCGRKENLVVHHIDYDKMNCKEDNLITLCKICHGFTNLNRVFWQLVFQFVSSSFNIVKKGWGFEFIPISTDDYCLKMLVFYPSKRFSDHYHLIKNEAWYCLQGKFIGKMTSLDGTINESIFKKGEVLEISTGLSHQLLAIEPSIIIEVSTKDDFLDSYRIKRGD